MVQHVTQREKLDTDKALAWLAKHWDKSHDCPICGSDNWTISDDVVEVRRFRGGALGVGGPLYPYLVVTCSTCGHTHFFNALVAGLVEQQD